MQLPLEERREWQRRATHEIYQAAARALWASLDEQFNTPNPSDAAEFAALRCGPDESPDSFALRFKELAAFEHTLSEEGKTRAFAQKLCACARFKDYHAYYMTHMRSHRERAGPGSLVAFEWSHVTIDDHASLARQFLEDQLRQPRTAPAAGTALTAAQIASLPHGEVQRLTQALLKANPALRAVVNAAQHQPGSPASRSDVVTPAVALAATISWRATEAEGEELAAGYAASATGWCATFACGTGPLSPLPSRAQGGARCVGGGSGGGSGIGSVGVGGNGSRSGSGGKYAALSREQPPSLPHHPPSPPEASST